MNTRGSILLQVLVTGVILAMISAAILRVTLGSSIVTARVNSETAQKRGDEGGLALLLAAWNVNGLCTSGSGYTCGGASGSCNCTCSSPGNPSVVVRPAPGQPVGPPFTTPGQCQVTVTPINDPNSMAASDQGTSTF